MLAAAAATAVAAGFTAVPSLSQVGFMILTGALTVVGLMFGERTKGRRSTGARSVIGCRSIAYRIKKSPKFVTVLSPTAVSNGVIRHSAARCIGVIESGHEE
ncbi:hypothetical protein JCM33774_66140 [Actinophytocola sp. KF-1]